MRKVVVGLPSGVGLLERERDFRFLFLSQLASSVGRSLAFVALVIDVFDRTGEATWVSALLLAEFVPLAVLGIVLAPLVDRLPRRRLMVASDLVRATVFSRSCSPAAPPPSSHSRFLPP